MSEKEAAARTQLQSDLPEGVPVEFDSVFLRLSGFGVGKANERKIKLLKQAAPILRSVLAEGERVRFVSQGMINHAAETIFMGIWASLINQTVVIATDERILMLHVDTKGQPKSYVNQLPKTAIKKLKTGFGGLTLKSGQGQRNFGGIKGADRKHFVGLFQPEAQTSAGFEHLCSTCFVSHQEHVEHCPSCNSKFKSPKTAALRSLFLPGLGDWYLGHKFLAGMEMIGSLISWAVGLVLVAAGVEEGEPIVTGIGVGLIAFTNVIDALLTRFQGRKGLMSVDGALPSKAAQSLAPLS